MMRNCIAMNRRSAAITVSIILVFLFPVLFGQTVNIDGIVIDKKQYPIEDVLVKITDENVVQDSGFSNNLGQYDLHIEIVGVEDDFVPLKFSLNQNYPNPFNPSTTVNFTAVSGGSFIIHNILGQEIAHEKIPGPGSYTVKWGGANKQGKNVSAGIYLYTVLTSENKKTRKMILIDGGNGQKLNISGTMSQNTNSSVLNKVLNNEYLLSFEKDNMTNVYLPIIINGDTTINQTVNVGPVVLDTIPDQILSFGDTMRVDMDDFLYNDETGLYLPRDSANFDVDQNIVSYIAVQPETLSTWIDVIDSTDNALRDSLFLRVLVPYIATPLAFDMPGLIEINEDVDIDTLLANLNDYVLPSQDVAFNLLSQSNPGLVNLALSSYSVLVDSLRQDGYGESMFRISASNADTTVIDSTLLRVIPVNDAPIVTLETILTSVGEDTTDLPMVIANYSIFDPDTGESYTTTLINSHHDSAFISIDNSQVRLDSLVNNFNGLVNYRVIATDAGGLADTSSASLLITPVNDAPVVTINELVSSVGEDTTGFPITIATYSIEDPDNDSLFIYFTHSDIDNNGPVYMSINENEVILDSLLEDYNGTIEYYLYAEDNNGASDIAIEDLVVEPRPEPPVNITFLFKAAYPDTFLTSGVNVLTWRQMLADTSGYVGDLDSVVVAGHSVTKSFPAGTLFDINGKNSESADWHYAGRAYTFIRKGPDVLEQRSYQDEQSPMIFTQDDTLKIRKIMDIAQPYGMGIWLDHGVGTRRLPNGVIPVWWNTSGNYMEPDSLNLAWTHETIDTIMTWPYVNGAIEYQVVVGPDAPAYPYVELVKDPNQQTPVNYTWSSVSNEITYVQLTFPNGFSKREFKQEFWDGTTDAYEVAGQDSPSVSGGEFTEFGKTYYSLDYIGKPKTTW